MQLKHLGFAALAATASAQSMMNLTAALGSTPSLSNATTFFAMYPDLLRELSTATNITLLAPSNEAFGRLLSSPLGQMIVAQNLSLANDLMYHVLQGVYPASAITNMSAFVPTMLDAPSFTNVTGGQVVEVVRTGEDVTVFSGLFTNSTVTQADLNFTGGVIHVIDNVLMTPRNISTTAVAANLTALAGALTAANLVETLDTASDVTVFAPNNAAFQAIGSALPNLTVEQITSILAYHVVNGTVGYSSTLMNGTMLQTMNGMNVTITMVNGTTYVNSAKVVTPNVLVANGVVHVIDNVLNPDMTMATPNPTQSTQSAAFSGASSVTDVPYTSGVPTPTAPIAGGAGAAQSSATGAAASSAATGAAAPMMTGAIGAAALFAAGGAMLNM